ncbi:DUF354 domain-containing protein [Bacteroides fragilis]|uniref:DUF354 domain-containing protein n=1 Tax=Bacteroides TaxID=816 RepID=UPI00202E0D0A|nr:DUF354 domain-containing protein [Bacteroides fragilis]MCM0340572.1 DUF354 domain-containing protein [Bacteroides fragilis]
MNILIVTGHPAQVHNFRVLKTLLESSGHKVTWAATNKDISSELLKAYQIQSVRLDRPGKGILSKLSVLMGNALVIGKIVIKEKIDFIISRVYPSASFVSFILRINHVGLTDTEVSGIYNTIFAKPLSSLLTSTSFERQLRKDQIRYQANIELFYLHPNYFEPDRKEAYRLLNIAEGTPYVIVRLVSWNAYHDKQTGFSAVNKIRAVKEMSQYAKVFISAEGNSLPVELEEYRIKIPFEKIHIVLNEAVLFLGEGASMASECAMLGTYAINVAFAFPGSLKEEEKYGLLTNYGADENSQITAISEAVKLLQNKKLKSETLEKRKRFLTDHIDPTAFFIWFIENYPKSKEIMKSNPDYQYIFR